MNCTTTAACLPVLATLVAAAPVTASFQFEEYFENVGDPGGGDGPANLTAAGWQFSVQATSTGGEVWHEGPEPGVFWPDFPPFEGDHYLMIGDGVVADVGDAASAWAVLPEIAGIQPGDRLVFRLRGFPNSMDVIQVRHSPGGGTSTGADPFDVGDFTDMLFEEDLRVSCEFPFGCPMDDEWYYADIEVPATGRLAFRYFIPNSAGGSGSHVAIDALTVGGGITEPPYPGPGETVHWTAAGGPYVIPDNRTIVASGTVIVDAGAAIDIVDDKTLHVLGELRLEGTAAAPITFDAPTHLSEIHIGSGGAVAFDHTQVSCRLVADPGDIFGSPGSELVATNTLFHGDASLGGNQLGHARVKIIVRDCVFQGTKLQHVRCQADVRDTQFFDAGQNGLMLHGYVYIDNVSSDNGQIALGARRGPQAMLIDNVSVTNYPDGGGFVLSDGKNFLIGPNVVNQNNRYPIELGADLAGILPGSTVPSSGNTNNYVIDALDFDPGGNIVWAPLDVPYVVAGFHFMPALRILPGTTVQFMPGAAFYIETRSDLIALGTPDAPIVFEGFAGASWGGLDYLGIGSGVRLDHCRVSDAQSGSVLIQTLLKIDNCTFEDNGTALNDGYGAVVRKSRFFDNGVGVESPFDADGTTNPNSFVGNGTAVAGDGGDDARGNWWGAASGPTTPSNPGGSGDAIVGPVPFLPFLTAAPDFTDHPPTVRLMESSFPSFVPGTKVILNWSVDDDGPIVSQRVLFSDFGHYPDRFDVVADLHPTQRSFEFTVPDVGLDVPNAQQAFRIESVDAAGQIGWDELTMYITVADLTGAIEFTSDFDQAFEPGDSLDVTWNVIEMDPDLSGSAGSMLFDADSEFVPLGGWAIGAGQLPALIEMPDVSTDAARIAIVATATLNRQKWFFSPEFTIRPDTRIGDAPPTITLTSPGDGPVVGGRVVPIAWTANDDEGIHSFVVTASYDGGDVWHHVTGDLPPAARSYDWHLPASTGMDDLRVRVTVRDTRFQNSSATAALSITPGPYVAPVPGDVDGNGIVDFADLLAVLAAWGTAGADVTGDGTTDFADLLFVLAAWSA